MDSYNLKHVKRIYIGEDMALNYGSGASGALSGAAAGSAILPGWGTAIGALVGGAAGLFGGKQKKQKIKKRDTLNPMQKRLFQQYNDAIRGKGPLAGMFNFDTAGANANFDQNIGRPAYRQFQENIIPGITGSFRQGNLQNSSYLGQNLSRTGRDVQEGLDAQRSDYIFKGQQQANQNKIHGIDSILNTQTFAYERPQEQAGNSIDQILGKLAPAAGEYWADYMKNNRPSNSASPATPAATAAPIA